MSHNKEYRTYTERKSEKAITDEINAYVKKATWRECGGGGGLYGRIRFIDKVMPDYDSAYEYISQNDRGDYDNLAVKYKEMPHGKSTKKLDELKEKLKVAYNDYEALNNHVAAKDFKSEFVGCKHCGSKINREYIRSNACPVCRGDMRSDTTQKRLENMRAKVNRLRNDIKDEEKKLAEKHGQVCWLVKFEYHT